MNWPRYFDKEGNQITRYEWTTLFEKPEYKIIQQTKFGRYMVSTVWLGLDHSFNDAKIPVIFETMVFKRWKSKGDDLDVARYTTLEQAKQGHARIVRKWRRK